jgi:acyl carrier protein
MDHTALKNISEYIASEILKQPGKTIEPNEALISSGLIDSFSLMDLSIFIDETFGVRIEDTELNADTFDTLEELIQLIEQKGYQKQEL